MTKSKLGLCLSGGGITGAMYEVGCLAALEDHFVDFRASDFDVVIGASSGASVATALASGLPALRMYRALLDPADDFFPLRRHHLLRLDGHETRRVAGSVLGALRRTFAHVTSDPLRFDVWTELDRFYDSLPAGVFSIEPFERFFLDFMVRRGIPARFGDMPQRLLLLALDLDAGERVVFGRDEEDVLVSRAVAASSAVPGLFAPVRVGERDCVAAGVGEAAHVDLAVERGCELVVVVNAVVPVRANPSAREVPTGHGRMPRIRDKGFLWVYQQTLRHASEACFRAGLTLYRQQHREVDVVALEPERSDATLLLYSPTNFTARRAILEHAYTTTSRALRADGSPLRTAFERHGLRARTPSTYPSMRP